MHIWTLIGRVHDNDIFKKHYQAIKDIKNFCKIALVNIAAHLQLEFDSSRANRFC